MSHKFLFTSTFVALSSGLALFAAQKVRPDPVGPPSLVDQQTVKRTAQRPVVNETKPVVATQAVSGPTEDAHQWTNADHALATCVAGANQVEISLATLASEKSQHPEVKKFAAMLAADHKAFLQKLKDFAPEATQAGYLTQEDASRAQAAGTAVPAKAGTRAPIQQTAVTEDAKTPNAVQTAAGTRPGHAAHHAFSHMQIEREMALQCLASNKEMLDAKSGAEFDKCFLGEQVGMHMHMKDTLIVFQRHASSELGQVLAAGQQKTEEHMAKAIALMKELDHGSASTDAAPNATNKKAEKPAAKE